MSSASRVEVAQPHGAHENTLEQWRANYAKLYLDEAKRLRRLADEIRRLKKLVADLALDHAMLKDAVERMW